jgi:hypothetical protein
MAPASINVTGHWEVEMQFFTSKSTHKFFLEQEGNWIKGTHTSDYAMQEMAGMIEGDEVKLKSHFNVPGNSINYWFSGKVSNGTFNGSVFLAYRAEHKKINVPGGPPLAT